MLTSKSKIQSPKSKVGRRGAFCLLLTAFCLLSVGCRYDMQDQPRYKAFKKSDFFSDGKAMRDLPEGTVARGYLREDKAFYMGKKENAGTTAPVESTVNAVGNTVVSSFPDAIEKSPVPLTKELLDRGEQRYKVFCIVCHGPVGKGDGMIVRRGFSPPPTYHDDRLKNAPDGHFYDVIANGWGKMNGYASQIPPADRWAIVAYIRALQISQSPNGMSELPMAATTNEGNTTKTMVAPLPKTNGGKQ